MSQIQDDSFVALSRERKLQPQSAKPRQPPRGPVNFKKKRIHVKTSCPLDFYNLKPPPSFCLGAVFVLARFQGLDHQPSSEIPSLAFYPHSTKSSLVSTNGLLPDFFFNQFILKESNHLIWLEFSPIGSQIRFIWPLVRL